MKKIFSKQMLSYLLTLAMLLSVLGNHITVSATADASEPEQTTSELSTEIPVTETTTEISTTEEKTTEEASTQEKASEETKQDDKKDETQTTNEYVYETEGYKVLLKIDSAWDDGFNATVTLSNTGEQKIEDWYLTFELPNKILNIWNAAIVEDSHGCYTIKNASWNQDIPAGGSVSFGFTAQGKLQDVPVYYGLPGRSIKLNEDAYSVEYVITEDWVDGFTGKVIIKNNSDKVLEDWYLEFDFNNEITKIWNAVIEEHTGNHYVINNDKNNSDIPVGGSVEFGFQVEKGSAADLIYNVVVSQRGIGDDSVLEGVLLLAGKYIKEDNTLDMLWSGTWQQGEYTLYIAENGHKYDAVATLTDTTYSYKLDDVKNGFNCYVVQCIDDKTLKSNVLSVLYKDGKFIVDIPDTDNDGIYDYIEKVIGTDITKADTDGDGLNDYYEYFVLNTDPLKKDTDGDGISDADEDFDSDGLTNKQEMIHETEPFLADTDRDGLNDGDEVNLYSTDPNTADTDGDLLPDGDEIRFGTDPFVEDTDGDGIPDGEETYTVTLSSDDIENDGIIVPSLTMDLEGYLVQTLFVNMIENDHSYINERIPGYIGCGYDFNVSDRVRNNLKADITYTFDKSLWEEEGFSPAVFYFNEDTKQLEKVETQSVKDNSVEFSVTHFSIYILLDESAFDAAWDGILTSTAGPTYLGLLIDGSGSMSTNDRNNIRYTCSDTLIEKLNDTDQVAVVGFDSSAHTLQPFTSDKSAAKLAVRKTYTNGGTDIPKALRGGIDLYKNVSGGNKLMILLTDGSSGYTGLDDILEDAVGQNIIIFTIGLGSGVNASKLKYIAETTGGQYFFASKASDLDDAYNDLLKSLDDDRYLNTDNQIENFDWVPSSNLAMIMKEWGFNYYPKDDIMYSTLHPRQEQLGYCYLYDELSFSFKCNIDCEPIYFFYNGKEYMIEFWKGQYGIETGGEVGIYSREPGEKRDSENIIGKWYGAVKDPEYIGMKFTLYHNNQKTFNRVNQRHWWLTGFRWGELTTEPSSLTMDVNMVFPNAEMAEAFVKGYSGDMKGIYENSIKSAENKNQYNNDDDGKYGLINMGYHEGTEYTVNGNEVHVIFDDTKAKQPLTRTTHSQMTYVNGFNKEMTVAYNIVKAACGVSDNDPNNFKKEVISKMTKKDLYECLINMYEVEKETFNEFLEETNLTSAEKAQLRAIVNNKLFDSFSDELYKRTSKQLEKVYADAYAVLENITLSMSKGLLDAAETIVGGLPK